VFDLKKTGESLGSKFGEHLTIFGLLNKELVIIAPLVHRVVYENIETKVRLLVYYSAARIIKRVVIFGIVRE
jgi:hypothetical protein